MNKTKVELPDGRLVIIEGGDAAGTARFLINHYFGPTPQNEDEEEALEIPGMTFEERTKNRSVIDPPVVQNLPVAQNAPVSNAKEEPLELPVMRFGK